LLGYWSRTPMPNSISPPTITSTDRAGNEWLCSADDEDLAKKLTWHVTSDGYVVARDPTIRKTVRFHVLVGRRLRLGGQVVDHVNREPRDNTRANLRAATRAENTRNREKTSRRTHTKYIGVSRDRNKFVAHITFEGHREVIGRFSTAEEAAAARDARAKQLHGVFACLNDRAEVVLALKPRRRRPSPPLPRPIRHGVFEAVDSRGRKWWFSRADAPLYWAHTWHVWTHPKGNVYVRAGVAGGRDLRFHREALIRRDNPQEKDWQVDHRNGNGWDNRRSNLRVVTAGQNAQNNRKRKKSTRSQYKGVDYNTRKQRYLVSVQVEGEKIHVGTFRSEVAAAIVLSPA
jgi:hypothetical protein